MRLLSVRLALLSMALAAFPAPAAWSQIFDDPSDSWDLERYRQTRRPEDPSGAILPVPDPGLPCDAPALRRAQIRLDAAGAEGDPLREEAGGIRIRDGVRGRIEAAGVLPLASRIRCEVGGRARVGDGSASGGEWTEGSLRWLSERTEIGLGLTQMGWGDADEGSLLLGRSAPPRQTMWVRSVRPWRIPRLEGWGRLHGSFFLSYLDDGDRTIPYPLLHGHRIEWEPGEWFRASFARTILLGGAGRTEKFQPGDIWDLFWGSGENVKGERDATDTDQKASAGVELRLPERFLERAGLDGLRIYWEYAGEDALDGLLPSAVARAEGAGIGYRGWTLLCEYLETLDDANPWYTHTIYGPDAYSYRGYCMGHPMGTGGRSWHLRATTPEIGACRGQIWLRSRGSGYENGGDAQRLNESVGSRWRWSPAPRVRLEIAGEISRERGAMRPRPDPPVGWQAGIGVRYGGTGRWDP